MPRRAGAAACHGRHRRIGAHSSAARGAAILTQNRAPQPMVHRRVKIEG
eukprot:SAG31_NODE_24661_length_476_cov_7.458886_1_plen_48_part_10